MAMALFGGSPGADTAQKVRQISYSELASDVIFILNAVAPAIIHLSVINSQYFLTIQNTDPVQSVRIGGPAVQFGGAPQGLLLPPNTGVANPLSRVTLAFFQAPVAWPLYAIADAAAVNCEVLVYRASNTGTS